MSLINEALKRTRDAAYQSAQTSPPVAAEYHLRSEVKEHGAKRMLVTIGISAAGVLVGIIGLAVWVVPRIQSVTGVLIPSQQAPITEAQPRVPATSPAPAAETLPKTQVTAPATPQPAIATSSSDAKGTEDQIVSKVMERIKAEQPPVPASPQLVLQGITFAADNRDAMINGVTVHEGEEIRGARVVTIENRRVRLNFNGQEIILRLP